MIKKKQIYIEQEVEIWFRLQFNCKTKWKLIKVLIDLRS